MKSWLLMFIALLGLSAIHTIVAQDIRSDDQFGNRNSDLGPSELSPEQSDTNELGNFTRPPPLSATPIFDIGDTRNLERFTDGFSVGRPTFGVGVDLYSPKEFQGGLIIYGDDVAMKIGGLVKADFIYDLQPIDATDSFDTTSIPVNAAPRTNARFHARQTRLNFDTRWAAGNQVTRVFVEGDFFGEENRFRLRHAYGEVGSLLVGQTWTTFTDVASAPATLDFEGSVSSVNRRQAQARWTQTLYHDDLKFAFAIEDTRFILQLPDSLTAESRTPSPDIVAHLRLHREWGRFQLAGLYRVGGIQPTGASIPQFGDEVITGPAWGLNFTGVIVLTENDKMYYQVVFGQGIGSYRGLPDAAPVSSDQISVLPMFGWMVGFTHNWTADLSSNFTYAQNHLDNTPGQLADDVHQTTYLAANMIYSPVDRVKIGVEYLYGIRQNVDNGVGKANRLQVAFIFDLP